MRNFSLLENIPAYSMRNKRNSKKGLYSRKLYACSYIVTFPDGHEIRVGNLSEFCKKNNLSRSALNKVAIGGQIQHKGFTCKKDNYFENYFS
jgi:hypothetical protein